MRQPARWKWERRAGLLAAVGAVLLAAAPAWGDSYVYVANLHGTISQFGRSDGQAPNPPVVGGLVPLSPATVNVPGSPYGIAVAEGDAADPPYHGTFLYATNGGFVGRVSQYQLGLGGLLSATTSVEAGGLPRGVAVARNGNSVFAANQGANTASQFLLEPGAPSFLPMSPGEVAAGSSPAGVAVGPAAAYVTNRAGDTVSQYSLSVYEGGDSTCDGPGCALALSPKSPPAVATGDSPFGVAVSPNGRSVYVTNAGSNSVSQYAADGAGALSPKSPATIATQSIPLGVAISPDGRSLYVANQGSDSVSQYTVDASTGVLTPKSPATVAAGGEPTAVAVSVDGKSVYVTNLDDGTVSQYVVGGDGALTPMKPATVKVGTEPYAIAVSPDMPRKVGRAIRVVHGPVRVNRRRVAAIPVSCPTRLDRCRVGVTVRVVGSPRVIARGRVTVRGARKAGARVRLSRRAYTSLRRRGRMRVRVAARALHAAGNRSRHATTVTLRASAEGNR